MNDSIKLQHKCEIPFRKKWEPSGCPPANCPPPNMFHILWVILYSFLLSYLTAPVCSMLPINWVLCGEHAECVTFRCDSSHQGQPYVSQGAVQCRIELCYRLCSAVACWLDNLSWADVMRKLFMWFFRGWNVQQTRGCNWYTNVILVCECSSSVSFAYSFSNFIIIAWMCVCDGICCGFVSVSISSLSSSLNLNDHFNIHCWLKPSAA